MPSVPGHFCPFHRSVAESCPETIERHFGSADRTSQTDSDWTAAMPLQILRHIKSILMQALPNSAFAHLRGGTDS